VLPDEDVGRQEVGPRDGVASTKLLLRVRLVVPKESAGAVAGRSKDDLVLILQRGEAGRIKRPNEGEFATCAVPFESSGNRRVRIRGQPEVAVDDERILERAVSNQHVRMLCADY
jgi:hypothetical protein